MSCNHSSKVGQSVSQSQKGWEDLTQHFRKVCELQLEKLEARLKLNVMPEPAELIHTAQVLQLGFDLEQASKVFDDTINHTKETMNHKKKQYKSEQDTLDSRGPVGFLRPDDDDDYYDEDYDDEDDYDDDDEY